MVMEVLREGMTKDDVLDILGEPQNSNSEYVWMWCEKYDSTQQHRPGLTWHDMSFGRSGYFLLFYNDVLLHDVLLKNEEANPVATFSSKTHMSLDEARRLLSAQ